MAFSAETRAACRRILGVVLRREARASTRNGRPIYRIFNITRDDRRETALNNMSAKRRVSIPLYRLSLIAAAVAAQLAAAQLASAQVAASKVSSDTEQQADGPHLSEIIVTARRTDENLQTTPISITTLSATDIAQHGITNVVDLTEVAPSVTIMPGGNYSGQSALTYIRGVGQDEFTFAFDPGVGFYIDDVYYGSVYGSIFNLGDIADLEVLRGPQGTLFGQNNEGGAILLSTPQPKGDNSGSITAGYGTFRREYVKGDFDVPLIPDKLALRVSGGMNQRNGYVTRVDFACAHPEAAGNLQPAAAGPNCVVGTEGGINEVMFSAALKWWVNDDMTIIVRGSLSDSRDQSGAENTLIQNSPQPGSQAAQYDQYVQIPTYGVSAANPLFATGNPYTSYSSYREPNTGFTAPPVNNMLFRSISGTLDWSAPGGIHAKNIVAYQKYESEFVSTDGTPFAATYLEDNKLYYRQFTEELQLSGKLLNDRLDWIAGGYDFSATGLYGGHIELPNTNIVPPGTPGFPPGGLWGLNFNLNDPTINDSRSGFLHFVYHATSKLGLELGARYSTDTKTQWYRDVNTATVPFDPLLPPGTPTYPPGTGGSTSLSHTDPKFALQYQWTPDLMTYTQVSTGYKTGGLNPKPVLLSDITPFRPEHLTAYEVGVKSEWLDHRLMLNADTYLSQYKDIQLSEFLPPPLGDGGTRVVNAARARIEGFELDMRGKLFQGFEMDGGGSFINYRTLAINAPPALVSGLTVESRPPYIPRWQGSFGAQYTLHFGAGDVTARADYSYRSRAFFDLANTVASSQGGYGLLNTRLQWDNPAGKWSAALEISNATNKLYYYAKGPQLNADYTVFAVGGVPALPRTEFFTVTRKF
jgi:iron complex outermembrane receptor protein